MKGYRCKGAVTVFFSLVSVLFLSLICTLAESARVQGARAWAAAVTEMGLFSVFSEYEKELLEEYEMFCLDRAYGTGEEGHEQVAVRMKEFMEYNTNPLIGQHIPGGWNLFPMEVSNCSLTGYSLMTDERGEAYYQQIVKNIMENLPMEVLEKYKKNYQAAKEEEKAGKSYGQQESDNAQLLEKLEKEQKQKEAQIEIEKQKESQQTVEENKEENREGSGEESTETAVVQEVENPLEEIEKIKKMGILGLVVENEHQISSKSWKLSTFPSGRKLKQGSLPVKKEYTGIVADGIFQDYLLEHFGNFCHPEEEGGLSYSVEYILMGKESDVENLKGVVHRLLLFREGVNFVYLLNQPKMRAQASALAVAIAGALPVPGLAGALELALLFAWAYGESLMDVRTLLAGGKAALIKDDTTWKLSLKNLGNLTEMLKNCEKGDSHGVTYEDYLRVLLVVCGKEKYPLRALDIIESKRNKKSRQTKADDWVIRAEAQVSFTMKPVFLKVAHAFMGLPEQGIEYEMSGTYGY